MAEAQTFQLVQFCPSTVDDVRINIGVSVTDGHRRHLELLSPDDLDRRCKAIGGRTIPRSAAILQRLRSYSEETIAANSSESLDLGSTADVPAIFSVPERFNNIIRVSEPRAVVFGALPDTAAFLMDHLVPVSEHTRQERVATRIRNSISAKIPKFPRLVQSVINRPMIEFPTMSAKFDFGFGKLNPQELVMVMNFNRTPTPQFFNKVNSLTYLCSRVRDEGATIQQTAHAALGVSRDVGISMVYQQPGSGKGQDFLEEVKNDWTRLGLRYYPSSDVPRLLADVDDNLSD